MASGILASRNGSNWVQPGAGFMAKTLISNRRVNPNPNSAPAKRQQQIYANAGEFNNGRYTDESPGVAPSVSDDAASSMNHKKPFRHGNTNNAFSQINHVSFNVSAYSRVQAAELKNRLVEELNQIRSLTAQIQHGELGQKFNSKNVFGSGVKRANASLCASSGRDPKRISKDASCGNLMKMCGQLLGKLMRLKNCWVFNTPVDADAMQLHDYFQIVKKPMDLGTVRSRLSDNMYPSPMEFAADVRLTFSNAILYNPKGHEISLLAEHFLSRFEGLFQPIFNRLLEQEHQQDKRINDAEEEVEESTWNLISPREKLKKPNPQPPVQRNHDGIQASTSAASNPLPSAQSPVPTPSSPLRQPPVKSFVPKAVPGGKLPKPKAKDPNKREMSMEEKQKLGLGLQSLPPEKMLQVVQIIRKRNEHLTDGVDEIELDIEAIDTETLWELDRLVTNWKKNLVSKARRQSLMADGGLASIADDGLPASEGNDGDLAGDARRPRKGEAGDEDVDIGDEIPVGNYPPVEIEKDDGPATSSSSSSSSSGSDSSSSDSDSGSSSGSDSDGEDVQSRGLESKK